MLALWHKGKDLLHMSCLGLMLYLSKAATQALQTCSNNLIVLLSWCAKGMLHVQLK
jgi:hypothetical protein